MQLVGRGYLLFAWRYPELYSVMYGLDGAAFSTPETHGEGQQIEDVVAATVKDVLESQGWSISHLADRVNILWSMAHGLVALTMANRLTGGQAQAMQLLDRALRGMLLTWEYDPETHTPDSSTKGVTPS